MNPLRILLFLLISTITLPAQTIIFEEDFETDGNGTRYNTASEFFDSEDDYWGRLHVPTLEYNSSGSGQVVTLTGTGSPSSQIGQYSGQNGNYLFSAEDLDDNGGDGIDEKSLSFSLDISTSTGLSFRGLFGACNENGCGGNVYDNTDYIKVFYQVDGGGFIEALCFNIDLECNIPGDLTNEPMHHDPDCDGDGGEGAVLSCALDEYTFSIPNGNTLDIRIDLHADEGEQELAFDHLRIYADMTLPVELTQFTVEPSPEGAHLFWETASEQNSQHFEILRSYNGFDFESIGRIEAAGFSNEKLDYHFYDSQISNSVSTIYYQLLQVDFDGTEARSDVRTLTQDDHQDNSIAAYPNPVHGDQLFIAHPYSAGDASGELRIWDLNGRLVYAGTYNLQTRLEINGLDQLALGVYQVEMVVQGESLHTRFIKQ